MRYKHYNIFRTTYAQNTEQGFRWYVQARHEKTGIPFGELDCATFRTIREAKAHIDTLPRPTHYIVADAAAQMPQSCWGVYRRVAILEVDQGLESVAMISFRARGVVRVVRTWERLHVGSTERCAYRLALREAEAEADALNAAKPGFSS